MTSCGDSDNTKLTASLRFGFRDILQTNVFQVKSSATVSQLKTFPLRHARFTQGLAPLRFSFQ